MTHSGIIEIFTIAKVRSRTTEQIHKRKQMKIAVNNHVRDDLRHTLFSFLVILQGIIVAFIT